MNSKRFVRLLPAFTLVFLAVSGCDSSLGLDQVSLIGVWDGVGDLQTTDDARGLKLYIQSHEGGVISGQWSTDATPLRNISGGSAENDEIRFTLQGFPGEDPTFVGQLSQQHRMAGSMEELELSGPAVLLRRSVDPGF